MDGCLFMRFNVDKWYDEYAIFENSELLAVVGIKNQARIICDRLNELYEK